MPNVIIPPKTREEELDKLLDYIVAKVNRGETIGSETESVDRIDKHMYKGFHVYIMQVAGGIFRGIAKKKSGLVAPTVITLESGWKNTLNEAGREIHYLIDIYRKSNKKRS